MNRNYIEIAHVLKSGESHKIAHPVHDLGVMAVELKKFFGLNKRAPERADSYIGHFLWQYSHGENEFYEIIRALPFFMSRGVAQDGPVEG